MLFSRTYCISIQPLLNFIIRILFSVIPERIYSILIFNMKYTTNITFKSEIKRGTNLCLVSYGDRTSNLSIKSRELNVFKYILLSQYHKTTCATASSHRGSIVINLKKKNTRPDEFFNFIEVTIKTFQSDEPSQLESRFECSICIWYLNEAVLTSCGHRFCKKCITSWLK